MRFERIEIRNLRSFGAEKTVIELPADRNLVAVVGANNAGKSNLIAAVRLALGAARRADLDPADFHQLDITQEVRVEVRLRTPLKKENIFRTTDEIHGFFYRAWRGDRGEDKGRLKFENYCLDASGHTYRPPAAIKRGSAPADPDTVPVRFLPAPASRIVPLLGRVHYLTPSLYRAFDTSGYGVLAQLLDLYRDDFRSAANTYELPDGSTVPRETAYERFSGRMEEILRTPKLASIEQSLSDNLRSVLGPRATGAEVSLSMPSAEELLADILTLHVQDDVASPALAVERLGDGYRSLVRLAILRTYADFAEHTRPAVFLIEEPEAYLNPHLRRVFAATLRSLAELGNDVMVTTHDAAFVSVADYPSVLRVSKETGCSKVCRCTAQLDFSYERVAEKLRRGSGAEVLFAQRAVLCEGQDDVAVTRTLLDRLGVDVDRCNISVVDCGGRENLPDYIQLLDQLHIELLVVTDGDASKIAAADDGTAQKVEAVEKAADGRMFRFAEDIEAALGTAKTRNNTRNLVELIERLDLDGLPAEDEVAQLAEALKRFCGDGSAIEAQPPTQQQDLGDEHPAASAAPTPAPPARDDDARGRDD
ncbi:MAG: ATP-dependent nuclease [Candidatus Saccharimonadales bacterium]